MRKGTLDRIGYTVLTYTRHSVTISDKCTVGELYQYCMKMVTKISGFNEQPTDEYSGYWKMLFQLPKFSNVDNMERMGEVETSFSTNETYISLGEGQSAAVSCNVAD
jgi:hypothetical protein